MNLDAIAEKLYKELHTPWLGDKAVIRAALAQVRDDALEEAAKVAQKEREADPSVGYGWISCAELIEEHIRAMNGNP